MGTTALGDMDQRIHDATLRCLARWGVGKTTLDDVAREAGCSRATIYRTFSGGKQALLAATVARELTRLRDQVDAAIADVAPGELEDLLVAGVTATARFVADHEALQFLLAHEPDVILPHVAFDRLDVVFRAAATFAEPHLARFVPTADAARAAEWVARVIVSYTLCPADELDLRREDDARRLVRTYLVPGLHAPSPQRS
jgi:AcrR family transcriptional regulator